MLIIAVLSQYIGKKRKTKGIFGLCEKFSRLLKNHTVREFNFNYDNLILGLNSDYNKGRKHEKFSQKN